MSEEQSVSRRRFVKAVGAGSAVAASSVSGCIARAQSDPNTVQIAANTDLKNISGQVEKQLKRAGMPDEISIEIIAGTASTGARQQQYNRWLSANLEQPSLLMMDSGWTIPFIVRDQLANLSEVMPDIAEMVKSNYFQTFTQTATSEQGNLHAVPLFPTTGNMLYRKDLVKEAGYSPEKEGWATNPLTWKKFSKVTKDTKKQTDTRLGFTFQGKSYAGLSCCDFREFTGTWGGSYFGPKKNLFGPVGRRPVTVDSKPVVDATRMVRTFIEADADNALKSVTGGISPRTVLQWEEESSRKPFAAGNAVMHRNWPYAIAISGAEDAFGKDLGVMPIPYAVKPEEAKFDGYGGSVSSLGGWHMALNPSAKQPEAAKEVLRAMTKEKFQLFLFETLGYLPPRRSLFESQRAKQVPVMGRYLETLKYTIAHSIPRPVTVAWPPESSKIAQQANASFSGLKAPQRAMNQLARQIEEIEQASKREEQSQNSGRIATGGR
ncbi:sugar ABC transporter substrate binding protein [Halogeometricum pallidum JCM 14848]|uniref:Sugar ABC transporter substrate binding protein n=1 Tax=Halogeometricum pallidum JCM 14848 TaxID=1227487 RepID=M0CSE8_HALPD|nr:extracellular solute-binding protein [Halogeometricum pallidum]ELZ26136.1 sugar ABC transporter substrate binding protein [Halogeometricum pallidum JCM 14848]